MEKWGDLMKKIGTIKLGDTFSFTAEITDKATGKPYRVPFFFDGRVQDGKITKSYTYFDRLSVFHQLGIAPPPAPAAKKALEK